MAPKNRPDSILLVITYLMLIGLGGLFGGLMVLTTALPGALASGSFFGGGGAMLFIIGVAPILIAIVAGANILALWRGKAAGRAGTMILALFLAVISALSIPVLLLVGLNGIALYVPLLTAVTLLITGALVLWSLTRPAMRAYFT